MVSEHTNPSRFTYSQKSSRISTIFESYTKDHHIDLNESYGITVSQRTWTLYSAIITQTSTQTAEHKLRIISNHLHLKMYPHNTNFVPSLTSNVPIMTQWLEHSVFPGATHSPILRFRYNRCLVCHQPKSHDHERCLGMPENSLCTSWDQCHWNAGKAPSYPLANFARRP